MDQEVPHAGTPMAVPINFRFMRSSVDTDASIRIPMRRAADHRSDNKGSPMDGHTKCPHGTSGCKHVCDVHSCVTSWSCNYIQNPAYTLACRLGMALADVALCPMVSFRRGSWIVSRVVLPCGPGCQTTMSHGSTHGLIREHTRWRPDLSTCTVVFGRGPMVPSVTTALGVSVPTFWLSPQTPRCTVGKHPSRACPARESAPHGLRNLL